MNNSRAYLLKASQLTWENAEVIDSFFGPVALEMKNEDWKEASYDNTSKDGCVSDSVTTQRVCQLGHEETKKKIYVHLDYDKVINVCVLLPPADLNVKTKQPPRSVGDPPVIANPSERSQGDDGNACAIRQKMFTCKSDLTRHFRIHTGAKPFSCPQCERSFSQNSYLKKHLRVHSGVKEFSCDICHKAFTHKGNLAAHHRIHTGDKPFKCSKCNAIFSQKGTLDQHLRTHTGEAPYQCDLCEKKFKYRRSLKNHLLLHSEEKLFACTYVSCDKTFKTKGELQTHIRVHTKIKPYSCPQCKKTFSQSGNCVRHAKQCSVMKSVSADGSFVKTLEEVNSNS